jgi:hypothetical protein
MEKWGVTNHQGFIFIFFFGYYIVVFLLFSHPFFSTPYPFAMTPYNFDKSGVLMFSEGFLFPVSESCTTNHSKFLISSTFLPFPWH